MANKQKIQVKIVRDDQRVTGDGFYIMNNEHYHTDCANAPSVSSSELIKIDDSPLEYYDQSHYNPNAEEKKTMTWFSFGNAAHELILTGDLDKDKYAVRPETYKTWRGKDAQEWRAFREAEGKACLAIDDLDNLEGMAEELQKHTIAKEVFKSGFVEGSMFVQVGGVYVKARPDIITFQDLSVVNDYKTCNSTHPTAIKYDIKKYQYETKLANVAFCKMRLFGIKSIDDLSFILIFQKKTRPWGISVIPIDKDLIFNRVAQNLAAIEIFEQGMATGEWPDRTPDFKPYNISSWDQSALLEKIQTGIYPNIDSTLTVQKAK